MGGLRLSAAPDGRSAKDRRVARYVLLHLPQAEVDVAGPDRAVESVLVAASAARARK
jgi:hypothetical protein